MLVTSNSSSLSCLKADLLDFDNKRKNDTRCIYKYNTKKFRN